MAPQGPQPKRPEREQLLAVACLREDTSPIAGVVGSRAVCPICSSDLYEKKEELGALTQKGDRVESNLYHGSCITLMLAHKGQVMRSNEESADGRRACPSYEISWGLSPVSRRPIDGFMKIPPVNDHKSFIKFIDWNQRGKVLAEDLAVVLGALLPIDEDNLSDFVRKTFKVAADDTVSEEELVAHVLPYLQFHCSDMSSESPRSARTPLRKAADGLKMLKGVSHVYSLRATCKKGCDVASTMLVYELCLLLRHSAQLHFSQAWRTCSTITKAIVALAPPGSTAACAFVAELFTLADEEMNKMTADMLPSLSPREPCCIFIELTSRLQNSSSSTRIAVLHALEKWTEHASPLAKKRSIETFVWMASDPDFRVVTAAMGSLGSVSGTGNQSAIAAVMSNLQHINPVVKHCAERTMPVVAMNDPTTIDMFCSLLRTKSINGLSRVKAIKALGQIAERGNAQVEKELLVFAVRKKSSKAASYKRWSEQDPDSEDSQCRSSALLALGKVALKGDKRVMKSIATAIFDGIREVDCRVAEAAIRALARLTEKKDKWAIKILGQVLEVGHLCPFGRALRILVLELFAEIGAGGDSVIFRSAVAHFRDGDLEVRTQAVRTAGKVWQYGDSSGADQIQAITKGCGDALVKREAELAMERIAEIERNPPEPEPGANCTGSCTVS